jgi:hypothetical protein
MPGVSAPAWLVRALALDRSGLQPAAGARAAVGIVLPLLIGTAVGHAAEGAQAAAGALPAGVAAMSARFRPPTALMLTTTAGMTLSTFVGSLVAGHEPLLLLALALWGFAAGLVVTLGRAATIVGVQAVVAFVVFGRFPGGVSLSLAHAAWVAAGGLGQLVVAHVVRPPRALAGERDAVAAALDRLAVLADGVLAGAPGAPAGEAVAQARDVLSRRTLDEVDGAAELRGLVDEMTRVRLELQALSSFPALPGVDGAVRAVATWLRRLAVSVRASRVPGDEPEQLAAVVDQMRTTAVTTPERFVAARAAALLGQLRAQDRLATRLAGVRHLPLPRVAGLRTTVDVASSSTVFARRLRAALDPQEPALRHAVRLAVLLPVAELIGRALPWPHGWWVALTALVVLKPDYAATVQRGAARVIGTGGGVVVSGAIVGFVHPRGSLLVLLIAVFAWASYTVFAASYALYTFMLTALVVLLLSTYDTRPLEAVADRGVDTLIGGALALGGYLLWPTREAATLRASTAKLYDALAGYADAVFAGYTDPARIDATALGAAARSARRARAEVQASFERAVAEPARTRPDIVAATSVLTSARRIAIALHSLRMTLQDASDHVAIPEVATIGGDLAASLRALARGGVVVRNLREQQHELEDVASRGDVGDLHTRRVAVVAAHLDPLVDSVDTLGHVVGPGPVRLPA